jgi:DTW domain-containing protein
MPEWRPTCYSCRKPQVSCYCRELHPKATRPAVVILMHPLEARHRVGTGRMVHRCLSNSRLWIGASFDEKSDAGRFLADPGRRSMVLFPGPESVLLDRLSREERCARLEGERESVLVILDATWPLARKMLKTSPALQTLERVSFTPEGTSGFKVRRQPHPQCLSSLEAIHRVLGFFSDPADHQGMMELFRRMVSRQAAYTERLKVHPSG